jgi:hypothetical protein
LRTVEFAKTTSRENLMLGFNTPTASTFSKHIQYLNHFALEFLYSAAILLLFCGLSLFIAHIAQWVPAQEIVIFQVGATTLAVIAFVALYNEEAYTTEAKVYVGIQIAIVNCFTLLYLIALSNRPDSIWGESLRVSFWLSCSQAILFILCYLCVYATDTYREARKRKYLREAKERLDRN